MSELARLRENLTGELIEPESPGYDAARQPAMVRFRDVRPRAVARCASAADVALTLDVARRLGVAVVPRGGGHCFAGRSSTDGIVLDMTPMQSVTVSAGGVATIGAGARLAGVYDALHEHGLTLPAGCGASVGIAGLTLGGGLGILGRRYGLTCDRLIGAQVVLTDGRIVDCDADREPDLFWALRGAGGGQFGVVTSLVFDTVPAPVATRFELTWPRADTAAVVEAWQDWATAAPDGMNASLKIVAAADGPVEVIVFGGMLGTEAETAALVDELAALVGARPAVATRAGLPYRDLKRSLAVIGSPAVAAPETAGPVLSKSEFFRAPLPGDAITELLATFAAAAGRHRELNFTPMGGAYNRVPADATAFVHRTERFVLEHVAADDAADWVRRSWALAHLWGSGRVYPNFPDPELTDWAEAYHGGNHARLARIKQHYDPDRVLHFDQSV